MVSVSWYSKIDILSKQKLINKNIIDIHKLEYSLFLCLSEYFISFHKEALTKTHCPGAGSSSTNQGNLPLDGLASSPPGAPRQGWFQVKDVSIKL